MSTQGVVRMLFTGLVRVDENLTPRLELAETYRVSDDFKTYIFTLKDSNWSDGSPITAYDFEHTWKAAVTPAYSSTCTNLFFCLKNGKKAFLGQVSIDQLGVKALDDKTLMVELEFTNPHFLNVLIHSIFSPVHSSMRYKAPDPAHLICSGPFRLMKYTSQDKILLQKNPQYWNSKNVRLEELHYFVVKDPSTAQLMFEKHEIDWLGNPIATLLPDSLPAFRAKGVLVSSAAAGMRWMFTNTGRVPLSNANIRKALAYSIDRKEIMKNILHSDLMKPALGLIPQILKKERWHPWFIDSDVEEAKRLFAQGLQELGMTADQLPLITISYASATNDKIIQSIQEMWRKHLGVKTRLEKMDGAVVLSKWYDHDYDITWFGWVLQYNDPVNMLELFKYKNTQPNCSGWENADFIQHATASLSNAEESERWEHVEAAEKIFFDEMPSIPINDYLIMYVQYPYVNGVCVNHLYQVDFDRASIDEELRAR